MWQRLKDLQQEAENRRRFAQSGLSGSLVLLAQRVWTIAGLAIRGPLRRSSAVGARVRPRGRG